MWIQARLGKWSLLVVMMAAGCRIGYDELRLTPDGGVTGGAPGSGGASVTAGATDIGGTSVTGGASDSGGASATSGAADSGGAAAAGQGTTSGGAGATAGQTSSGGTNGVGGAAGTVAGGSSGTAGSTGGGATAPDAQLCDSKSFGGHNYLLCREERSWADANAGCMLIGMRLVRIDDATEDQWLSSNVTIVAGNSTQVWIGASDAAVEGEWRWTDGDLFWLGDYAGTAQNGLYANWYFKEPNNVGGNENCGSLETKNGGLQWIDSQCSMVWQYICESL